jgi:hypothetical protein
MGVNPDWSNEKITIGSKKNYNCLRAIRQSAVMVEQSRRDYLLQSTVLTEQQLWSHIYSPLTVPLDSQYAFQNLGQQST